jgi:ATP-dependent protease HslVU (ClpYQ) peptidase subunit
VLEPEDGLIGIGSGGNYALAAAKALLDGMDSEAIARRPWASPPTSASTPTTTSSIETIDSK